MAHRPGGEAEAVGSAPATMVSPAADVPSPITCDVSSLEMRGVLTAAPGLLTFTLASHATTELLVRLSSTLGDAVIFQEWNENLGHPPTAAALEVGPTDPSGDRLVGGAVVAVGGWSGGGGDGEGPEDACALFHEIGQIESVVMAPGERRAVVLVFRPAYVQAAAAAAEMNAAKESEEEAADSSIQSGVSIHTGVSIHSGSEGKDSLATAGGAARAPRQKWFSIIHTAGMVAVSAVNMPAGAVQGKTGAEGDGGGGDSPLVYAPLRLPLHARSCRSVLRSEVRELRFGNCVVGEPAHKDFTLWNCSEVPLAFRPVALFRSPRPPVHVSFTNLDGSGAITPAGCGIAGFSHARVRVQLMPSAAGDHRCELELTNLRDTSNVLRLKMLAIVSEQPLAEELLAPAALDFGECYALLPKRVAFTVRNISDDAIDVVISSDLAPDQVTFEDPLAHPPLFDTPSRTAPAAAATGRRMAGQLSPSGDTDVEDGLLSSGGEGSRGEARRGGVTARGLGASSSDGDGDGARETRGASDGASGAHSGIEELTIQPGRERSILIWYTPALADDESTSIGGAAAGAGGAGGSGGGALGGDDEDPEIAALVAADGEGGGGAMGAMRLARRTFRVDLRGRTRALGRETLSCSVACRARVCVSRIAVAPLRINLGDCEIQTRKHAAVVVKNLSDLPTTVIVSMHSKVLSTSTPELRLAPHASLPLQLELLPRRVNPDYRKQVTISNRRNPHDSHLLEVFANNVDRHNVSFHSLFYRLALLPPLATTAARPRGLALSASRPLVLPELVKLPPDACKVSFDDAVSTCVHVRAFSVANVSSAPLTIQLTPSALAAALAAAAPATPSTPPNGEDGSAAKLPTPHATEAPQEVEVGRISLFQLADSAGLPSRRSGQTAVSAWATVEEVAAKRELLHDRFESLPQRATSVTLEDTEGGGPALAPGGMAANTGGGSGALPPDAEAALTPAAEAEAIPGPAPDTTAAATPVAPEIDRAVAPRTGSDAVPGQEAGASGEGVTERRGASGIERRAALAAAPPDGLFLADLAGLSAPTVDIGGMSSCHRPNNSTPAAPLDAPSAEPPPAITPHEPRLRGSDLVGLAICFRDLHASPRQAAAAAAAIDGRAPGASALPDALSAWFSGGHSVEVAPALEWEGALVFMHTWFRRTVAALIRSGQLVQAGVVTLAPDEERVLLVRFEPVEPVLTGSAEAKNRDATDAEAKNREATDAQAKNREATDAEAKNREATDAQAKNREATDAQAKNREATDAQAKNREATDADTVAAWAAEDDSGESKPSDSLLSVGASGPISGAISVELVDYDQTLRSQHERRLQRFFPSQDQPPPQMVRMLPVVAAVRRSTMEIGQRSINFGGCAVRQLRENTVLLHNRSAAPLLFKVSKSGYSASFDLTIRRQDRLGCVRPFAIRPIRFLFRPSLSGPFREAFTVRNMQDSASAVDVVVKAQVHRSVTLHLSPAALDFGDVPLSPAHTPPAALTASVSGQARTLTISNTAKGTRAVSISATPMLLLSDGEPCAGLSLAVAVRLDRCTSEGAEEILKLERDRSELAETIQRKLRIAERKGRADKVAKWTAKLERLQAGPIESAYPSDLESDASDWGGNSETESEAEGVTRRSLVRVKSVIAGATAGGGDTVLSGAVGAAAGGGGAFSASPGARELAFRVGPDGTQTVAVTVAVVAGPPGMPPPPFNVALRGFLLVTEARDRESQQRVPILLTLAHDRPLPRREASSPLLGLDEEAEGLGAMGPPPPRGSARALRGTSPRANCLLARLPITTPGSSSRASPLRTRPPPPPSALDDPPSCSGGNGEAARAEEVSAAAAALRQVATEAAAAAAAACARLSARALAPGGRQDPPGLAVSTDRGSVASSPGCDSLRRSLPPSPMLRPTSPLLPRRPPSAIGDPLSPWTCRSSAEAAPPLATPAVPDVTATSLFGCPSVVAQSPSRPSSAGSKLHGDDDLLSGSGYSPPPRPLPPALPSLSPTETEPFVAVEADFLSVKEAAAFLPAKAPRVRDALSPVVSAPVKDGVLTRDGATDAATGPSDAFSPVKRGAGSAGDGVALPDALFRPVREEEATAALGTVAVSADAPALLLLHNPRPASVRLKIDWQPPRPATPSLAAPCATPLNPSAPPSALSAAAASLHVSLSLVRGGSDAGVHALSPPSAVQGAAVGPSRTGSPLPCRAPAPPLLTAAPPAGIVPVGRATELALVLPPGTRALVAASATAPTIGGGASLGFVRIRRDTLSASSPDAVHSRPPSAAASRRVHLLWRQTAALASCLRLEPPEMDFGEVRISEDGRGVADAILEGPPADSGAPPCRRFRILNAGAAEVQFVVMLRKDEAHAAMRKEGSGPSGGPSAAQAAAGGGGVVGTCEGAVVASAADGTSRRRVGGASLAALTLHPNAGVIPAGGSVTIEVRCVAPSLGRQRYVVVVRNLSASGGAGGAQDCLLPIRTHGRMAQHLAFPDLEADERGSLRFSLGLCYIHAADEPPPPPTAEPAESSAAAALPQDTPSGQPAFAPSRSSGYIDGRDAALGGAAAGRSRGFLRRRPLRISNTGSAGRKLVVTSNLLRQVLVFADEACSVPAGGMNIGAGEEATIWVCLQPHLSADVLQGGECRQLVGGLRLQLCDADGHVHDDQSLTIDATIGRSLLRARPRALRMLAVTAPASPPAATLMVSNGSERMPLVWRTTTGGGVRVAPAGGELPPCAPGGTSTALVTVSCDCPVPGYYRRSLTLLDTHAEHEAEVVMVEALVESGTLAVDLEAVDASGMPVLSAGTLHAVLPHVADAVLAAGPPPPPLYNKATPPRSLAALSRQSSVSSVLSSGCSTAGGGGEQAREERPSGTASEEGVAHAGACEAPARLPSPPTRDRATGEVSHGAARQGMGGSHPGSPGTSPHLGGSGMAPRWAAVPGARIREAFEPTPSAAVQPGSAAPIPVGGRRSELELLPGDAAAGGAHASFVLTNTSDSVISLVPLSDLPVTVTVRQVAGSDRSTGGTAGDVWRALSVDQAVPEWLNEECPRGGIRHPTEDDTTSTGLSVADCSFAQCGRGFVLAAGASAAIRLRLLATPRLLHTADAEAEAGGGAPADGLDSLASRLQGGALLNFSGLLLFEEEAARRLRGYSPGAAPRPDASAGAAFPLNGVEAVASLPTVAALKAVSVRGSVCVSLLLLGADEVNLGRRGYVDGWRDAELRFELRNVSAVGTECRLVDLPPEIEMVGVHLPAEVERAGSDTHAAREAAWACGEGDRGCSFQGGLLHLDGGASVSVQCRLKASAMREAARRRGAADGARWERQISFANVHNPLNALRLNVRCLLTLLPLRYLRVFWPGHGFRVSDPRDPSGQLPTHGSSTGRPSVDASEGVSGGAAGGGDGAGGGCNGAGGVALVRNREQTASMDSSIDGDVSRDVSLAPSGAVVAVGEVEGQGGAEAMEAASGAADDGAEEPQPSPELLGGGDDGALSTPEIGGLLSRLPSVGFRLPTDAALAAPGDENAPRAALVLPPLAHPALPSTPPCSTWFLVQNTSGGHLTLELSVEATPMLADANAAFRLDACAASATCSPSLAAPAAVPMGACSDAAAAAASAAECANLASRTSPRAPSRVSSSGRLEADDTVHLELLSRASHTPVSSVKLAPGEKVGLLLRAHLPATAPLPPASALRQPLHLGHLHVLAHTSAADGAGVTRDTLPIVGSLTRGASFRLNVHQLQFTGVQERAQSDASPGGEAVSPSADPHPASAQVEKFWLTNPSAERHMAVLITPAVPEHVGVVRVSPTVASLPPGGQASVEVTLLPRLPRYARADARILVQDVSAADMVQSVRIALVDAEAAGRAAFASLPMSPPIVPTVLLQHEVTPAPLDALPADAVGTPCGSAACRGALVLPVALTVGEGCGSAGGGSAECAPSFDALMSAVGSEGGAGSCARQLAPDAPEGRSLLWRPPASADVSRSGSPPLACVSGVLDAPPAPLAARVCDTSSPLPPPVAPGDASVAAADVDDGGSAAGDDSRPVLGLRGVASVGVSAKRFEINLGQQNHGEGHVERELHLEHRGSSAVPLRYRLVPLSMEESVQSWLTVAPSAGTLTHPHETHVVRLSCSTSHLEIQPVYLLLENHDNPADLKTVLVSMEMVVDPVHARSYFGVIVEAQPFRQRWRALGWLDARAADRPAESYEPAAGAMALAPRREHTESLAIDLGSIYHGQTYTNRSFVVENRASLPLHFSLSHSLAPEVAEVAFSLSNTTLKLFSTLLVPPGLSKRVYLHFRAEPAQPPAIGAADAGGGGSAARSAGPSPADALPSRHDISCEIAVRCHMVKDFQEVIRLSAACYSPSFRLSTTQLDFGLSDPRVVQPEAGCTAAPPDAAPPVVPASAAIVVSALGVAPLLYTVRSSCCFFKVRAAGGHLGRGDACGDGGAAGGGPHGGEVGSVHCHGGAIARGLAAEHVLLVTPDAAAIRTHAAFLLRLRYVEEHFTVYNQTDLNEHECVTVRLAVGHAPLGVSGGAAPPFTHAPSRHLGSYASALLEEEILTFHSGFKAFWDSRLGPVFTAHAMVRAARARVGAAEPLLLTCAADAAARGVAAVPAAAEREVRWPGWPGVAVPADAGPLPAAADADAEAGECRLYLALLAVVEAGSQGEAYARLWASFRHITDELVFYGTKAQTTHFVSPLASLCYKVLFRHEVFDAFRSATARQHRRLPLLAAGEARPFPTAHLGWFKQLSYFLMHFPDADAQSGMDPLRKLERALIAGAQHPAVPGGRGTGRISPRVATSLP